MAGKAAYVTNPAEAIRKLQMAGISPAGDRCVVCKSTVPVFYSCEAVCEASTLKAAAADQTGNGIPSLLLRLLTLSPIRLLRRLLPRHDQLVDAIRVGHDVHISFKLPICDPCAMTAGNVFRSNVAKKLLTHVSEYRDLISYYPDLKLTVTRKDK